MQRDAKHKTAIFFACLKLSFLQCSTEDKEQQRKTVDKRSCLLRRPDKIAHRFSLRLELLCVPSQLRDDLRHKVLRDDLMLARVVVELVQRRQEGPTKAVPGDTAET